MTEQLESTKANSPIQTEPALVGDKEAAAMLSLSVSEFHRLHSSGRLGFQKIKLAKKAVRYSTQEIREWAYQGAPSRSQWARLEQQQ